MHVHDQILLFVKANGPTLPTRVAKTIKTDIIIASAHLSDLSSQKKLLISNLKVGGSPLYYLPGQEDQLFRFAVNNLNPKDFIVLENLKEKKILREVDLDLLSKVALRALKDFAIPLQVRTKDKAELFWKWFSLSSEETNELIKEVINPEDKKSIEEVAGSDGLKDGKKEERQEKGDGQEKQEKQEKGDGQEKGEVVETSVMGENKESAVEEHIEEPVVEEAVEEPELAEPDKEELEELLEKVHSEDLVEEIFIPEKLIEEIEEKSKKSSGKKVVIKEEAELVQESESEIISKETISKEKQQKLEGSSVEDRRPLLEKLRNKFSQRNKSVDDDEFLTQIETYFQESQINIEQKEIIRKNKEINLLISVPSVVGKVIFFCKAKSKNRCDERDLSSAYMEAQMKRLPLLFIYTRDWTKKSQEMLDSGAFENAVVKKIENGFKF